MFILYAINSAIKVLEHTRVKWKQRKPDIISLIMSFYQKQYLVEAYESRVAENEKKKLMIPLPLDEELKTKVSSPKRDWGATWWEQYRILFCRGIKERKHDYFSWLRITQVLSTAIILGLLWWQSDSNTPKGLQDQVNPHCLLRACNLTCSNCLQLASK